MYLFRISEQSAAFKENNRITGNKMNKANTDRILIRSDEVNKSQVFIGKRTTYLKCNISDIYRNSIPFLGLKAFHLKN